MFVYFTLTEWQVYIPSTDCFDSNHGSDWFIRSSGVRIIPYCWSNFLSYWQWWRHWNQLFHIFSWGNSKYWYVFLLLVNLFFVLLTNADYQLICSVNTLYLYTVRYDTKYLTWQWTQKLIGTQLSLSCETKTEK